MLTGGASMLQPGQGFRDIYTGRTQFSIFGCGKVHVLRTAENVAVCKHIASLATIRVQQPPRAFAWLILCCGTSLVLLFMTRSRRQSSAAAQDRRPVRGQSQEEADRKSAGCITCHTSTDEPTMHPSKGVHIGCTDCHGGNFSISVSAGTSPQFSRNILPQKKKPMCSRAIPLSRIVPRFRNAPTQSG